MPIRHSRPDFGIQQYPLERALQLRHKTQPQAGGDPVILLDGSLGVPSGTGEEAIGHATQRPRSSRKTVGPSMAAISPRRWAERRLSASAAHSASTPRTASSSRLPSKASARIARSLAGKRMISCSRTAWSMDSRLRRGLTVARPASEPPSGEPSHESVFDRMSGWTGSPPQTSWSVTILSSCHPVGFQPQVSCPPHGTGRRRPRHRSEIFPINDRR